MDGESLLSEFFIHEDNNEERGVEQDQGQGATATRREAKWLHQCLRWTSDLEVLAHGNLFKRTYRMSINAFNKLREILGESIIFRSERSPVPEPIYPEMVMSIGLRYLSGGMCLDLKNVYGLSLPSVSRIRDVFIDAVISCPQLIANMKLLQTIHRCGKWRMLSSNTARSR
jgi:hypothetical protein